jgi:nucleoside 2-deoxyribosyltransferase
MLNVYLSGPITGTEDFKDRFEFGEIKVNQKFRNTARAINPVKIAEQLPENITYEAIMQICFDTINSCDIVLLMPGWEDSKGCNQEYGYAIGIGKEVVKWEEWF